MSSEVTKCLILNHSAYGDYSPKQTATAAPPAIKSPDYLHKEYSPGPDRGKVTIYRKTSNLNLLLEVTFEKSLGVEIVGAP